MRIVYWVGVPVAAAICGAFATSNRVGVSLGLWPLPFVIVLPLYLLVFAALAFGFAAGGIAAWFRGRHRRRKLRQCRRRIGALETELAATRPGTRNREGGPRPLPASD
jgi:lipopolysaccharide assembly protein A